MTKLQFASKQALFDHVVARLIAQGCGSINSAAVCVYDGPNDTACGLGHLTDDKSRRFSWDVQGYGASAVGALVEFADGSFTGGEAYSDKIERDRFFVLLQQAHDESCNYTDDHGNDEFLFRFREAATRFAADYSLTCKI